MQPITLTALLFDIRTERMLRFCCVYVACLACFFFWDRTVHPNIRLDVPGRPGGVVLESVIVPSETYFSILLVLGCVPIATHYSAGFQFLAMQALLVSITCTGIILTITLPAMKDSAWAGYLVVAASFSLMVGPPFIAVEPAVLHIYGMACAIMLEFLYTPLLGLARSDQPAYVDFLTIPHLWQFGIQILMVNLAVFIGIAGAAVLLPPWRTARVQLHARAAQALALLGAGFDAVAANLAAGAAAPQRPLPPLDLALLLGGLAPSKDNVEELASLAMLEPSFLHPGTLSAMPDAWKTFVSMLREVYSQAELLHRCTPWIQAELQAGGSNEQALVAEAAAAAGAVVHALARTLQLEHRGPRDVPLLDFNAFMLGFIPAREAAALPGRQQLQEELDAAMRRGLDAAHRLGSTLLARAAAAAATVKDLPALSDSATATVMASLDAPGDPLRVGGDATRAAELDGAEGARNGSASSRALPEPNGHPAGAAGGRNGTASQGEKGEATEADGGDSRESVGPTVFCVAAFCALTVVLKHVPALDPPPGAAEVKKKGKGGVEEGKAADGGEDGTAADAGARRAAATAASSPHGLAALVASVQEIQQQLRSVSGGNVAKQLLISLGLLQMVSVVKSWTGGLVALARLTTASPWRLSGDGSVWRQPIHVYYLAQFVAGVWALLAALTFWTGYRTWQDTGGHGGTWPLMAFLLVLQPTQEATLQKACMRIIATIVGVLLAWGLFTASSSPAFLIPISAVAVAPAFWVLPDARSCVQLRAVGDLQYFCVSYTFAYTMVMGYCGQYGAHETVVTRLASQVLGCVVAIVVCVVVFPVSGLSTAAAGVDEALAEMEAAAECMAGALQGSCTSRGGGGGGEWGPEVDRRLGRAERVSQLLSAHLASLKQYPLAALLAGGVRGPPLLALLTASAPAVPRKLQLLRFVRRDVAELLDGGRLETDPTAEAEVRRGVARQLEELAAALRRQRRHLRARFHARLRVIPLPYMPVYFQTIRDDVGVDDGQPGDPKSYAADEDPKVAQTTSPPLKLNNSMLLLQHLLQRELLAAVSGRPWGEVERELLGYLGGQEAGRAGAASEPAASRLSKVLERFGLTYHLYTAKLSSTKLHE